MKNKIINTFKGFRPVNSFRFIIQSFLIVTFFSCSGSGNGCYCEPPVSETITLNPDEVGIQFSEPSFVGDFSSFKSNGVNEFVLNAHEAISSGFTDINFIRPITWPVAGAILPGINPPLGTSVYKRTSHQPNPTTDDLPLIVRADFNDATTVTNWLTLNKTTNLKPGKISTVSTTIDVTSTPVLNLVVATDNDFVVNNAYVYDVSCQLLPVVDGAGSVHNGNLSLQTTKVNIAVMAEGYDGTQITDFIAYANAGFATTASIHFGMTNDFFDRYIQDFNFVRYDTISLESGVDTVWLADTVKSILNYNNSNPNSGEADMNRIKAVIDKSNKSGKCGLELKNVDSVIVLVNTNGNSTPQYFAHTWTFDWNSMGNKNGEPVHYIIVSAPVGSPGVATNAIAHELGHAMGSLSDEYTTSNDPAWTCVIPMDPSARNITNSFFGTPITSVEKWDGIKADYANAPNYPVKYEPNGNYCNDGVSFFRPTTNSSMRYWESSPPIPALNTPTAMLPSYGGIQYGPVNTYYMYGTYLNRINPSNTTRHKWQDYYNTFKTEWPMSYF
ncbi:MAG: M64 family metallopeptidase [Spirochaetia bacterium]|nr:M64 family metallopeptidase [Spirochaetia bacterium]